MKINHLLLIFCLGLLALSCNNKEEEEPAPDPNTFIKAKINGVEVNLIDTFKEPFGGTLNVFVARESDLSKVWSITVNVDTVGTIVIPTLTLNGLTYVTNQSGERVEYNLSIGRIEIIQNDESGFKGTFSGTLTNFDRPLTDFLTVTEGEFNF